MSSKNKKASPRRSVFPGRSRKASTSTSSSAPPPAELLVNCKEIPRINSVGVKAWIKYFQSAQAKGTKLNFIECSTAIVEQINLISNFICGGVVESVYVPFACNSARASSWACSRRKISRSLNLQLPELKCTKCGGKAVFDDIPEEYFGFLSRDSGRSRTVWLKRSSHLRSAGRPGVRHGSRATTRACAYRPSRIRSRRGAASTAKTPYVIFADASTEAQYQALETAIQETIGLFSRQDQRERDPLPQLGAA